MQVLKLALQTQKQRQLPAGSFVCLFVLRQGFSVRTALAVLELALVDQAGLELTEVCLTLLGLRAGTTPHGKRCSHLQADCTSPPIRKHALLASSVLCTHCCPCL